MTIDINGKDFTFGLGPHNLYESYNSSKKSRRKAIKIDFPNSPSKQQLILVIKRRVLMLSLCAYGRLVNEIDEIKDSREE